MPPRWRGPSRKPSGSSPGASWGSEAYDSALSGEVPVSRREETAAAAWPFAARHAVSFLVSFLPGRLQQGRFHHLASPLHVVTSGALEAIAASLVYLDGLVRSLEGFLGGAGLTFFQNTQKLDTQIVQGVGVIGMVSYLVSPRALVLAFLVVEGAIRLAEALVEGRLRGVALLSLPDSLGRAAVRAWKAVALELRLGPPAPDTAMEVERPVVGLRIESRENKPWPVHQALRYGEDFYVVARKELVRSSTGALRYRFELRRLPPEEVIRGEVLPLEAGSGRPLTWYGRVLWGLHR